MSSEEQRQFQNSPTKRQAIFRYSWSAATIVVAVIGVGFTLLAALVTVILGNLVSPESLQVLAVLLSGLVLTGTTLAAYLAKVRQVRFEDTIIQEFSQQEKELVETMTEDEIREIGREKTINHE